MRNIDCNMQRDRVAIKEVLHAKNSIDSCTTRKKTNEYLVEAKWVNPNPKRIIIGMIPLGSQSHSRISSLCVCARVPFVYEPSMYTSGLIPRVNPRRRAVCAAARFNTAAGAPMGSQAPRVAWACARQAPRALEGVV